LINRYDAFDIRGITFLVKRDNSYNLRTESETLCDLITADDQLNDAVAQNDYYLDIVDVVKYPTAKAGSL
jgi:hypothetical protein